MSTFSTTLKLRKGKKETQKNQNQDQNKRDEQAFVERRSSSICLLEKGVDRVWGEFQITTKSDGTDYCIISIQNQKEPLGLKAGRTRDFIHLT